MSFLDRFRRSSSTAASGPKPQSSGEPDAFDPEAHQKVLAYLRRLWQGQARDEEFERTSLGRELHFNSLNLAELLFAVSREREVPTARIIHFLRIGIPGGGDAKIATLFERVVILSEQFDEPQRIALLSSGVVGDRKEIVPIAEGFDTVGHMLKYCRAIESLKSLSDHDAIDAEFGWVDEDPDWK
jgi:hypothetical protein